MCQSWSTEKKNNLRHLGFWGFSYYTPLSFLKGSRLICREFPAVLQFPPRSYEWKSTRRAAADDADGLSCSSWNISAFLCRGYLKMTILIRRMMINVINFQSPLELGISTCHPEYSLRMSNIIGFQTHFATKQSWSSNIIWRSPSLESCWIPMFRGSSVVDGQIPKSSIYFGDVPIKTFMHMPCLMKPEGTSIKVPLNQH